MNQSAKHVLRKKDSIIANIRKLQGRFLKKSHNFGIELPKAMEQALALDATNGNTLWADAVAKSYKVTHRPPIDEFQYGI